ncbi:MAG: hypothetical protein L6R42_003539 [Xanthoria sp. 1 TBL-2021]|nr:MAG: hypothetical protein L6R42_003539 [Xanthoria sp. 1 TBL-2021]
MPTSKPSTSQSPARTSLNTSHIGSNISDFDSINRSFHSLYDRLNQQMDKAASQSLTLKPTDAKEAQIFAKFSHDTQKLVDLWLEWQEEMIWRRGVLAFKKFDEDLKRWLDDMDTILP